MGTGGRKNVLRARLRLFTGLLGVLSSAVICFAMIPAMAFAHGGHSHAQFDGRMADRPDSGRIGKSTYRFIPSKKEYEVRRDGEPPHFFHLDYAAKLEGKSSRSADEPPLPAQWPGPSATLPSNELAPHCRTTGKRIAVVYAHRPSDGTPTPTSQLRSIVRRMNWKFADQASQSSGGQRVVRMAVDCNASGEINVYNATAPNNNYVTLYNAAFEGTLGFPDLNDGKYLIFDHSINEENPGVVGVGGAASDAVKSSANKNTKHSIAVIYDDTSWAPWESHVTIHELSHAMGAAQGSVTPKAPFSTTGFHCSDGIDILCYNDGTAGSSSYAETKCPEPIYYDTVNVPIDCGKDTYFNAAPAPGTWLAEYWNLAGPENPFLVAPPKATTSPASAISGSRATLHGTVNPEGSETKYHFEYGPTTAYGSNAPMPSVTAGSGGAAVARNTEITGLEPLTTYNFRMVATSDVGTAFGTNKTFTTTGMMPPEVTTESATGIKAGKANLRGTLNPNGFNTTYHFEWGTKAEFDEGKYGNSTAKFSGGGGTSSFPVTKTIEGLKGQTEYHYRLVAKSVEGTTVGSDKSFTTLNWGPPTATTDPGEPALSHNEAFLRATINPREFATSYRFEWGTSTAYGNSIPVPDESIGSGTEDVKVVKKLESLQPGMLYHFRVVATNSEGTTYGEDRTVNTLGPPAITNEPATGVSSTEAVLNAAVYPNGYPTTYQFEYGPTAFYGTTVPIPAKEAGSGINPVKVSQAISGLEASKTYHFRIVAQNTKGSVSGADETFTTLPPCKGAEGKCEWNAQSTPGLSTSKYQLSGVSCASATMCFAVGSDTLADKGLGELWNGSEWSVQVKASSLSGSPSSVSCPSTTWCMAAGNTEGGIPKAWLLKEEGGKWMPAYQTLPTPSGGSKRILRAISCTSTTACTAVGHYYVESESKYKLLVERWNGTAWSTQTAAALSESSSIEEVGVSCATSSACIMAGTYISGTKPVSFAQSWNGTSWSALTTQNPGSYSTKLRSISCASTTSCVAVGSYKETKAQPEKPLAQSWNGSTWSTLSVPSPAEGAQGVGLRGVSCTTASACTAVGSYYLEGKQRTLAGSWNGTNWTIQASPNPSPELNSLNQVSCTAVGACTAVGSMQPEAGMVGEETASLAERWNGSEWKTQVTPSLATSEYSLSGVSCASATMCFAVGSYPLIERGLGQLWNGSTWTTQVKAVASINGYPSSVSCPSTTWCMVAGSGVGGLPKAWLLKEEGGEWTRSLQTPPLPSGGSNGGLRSVSCTSTSACTAVGYYYDEGQGKNRPLVEHWNGSKWTAESAPSPVEGSAATAMMSVSCASGTSCVAVGEASNAPFAERWDGTSWSVMTTPLPAGAIESGFENVSCGSPSGCMAVGTYKESGKGQYPKPLAQRWNGSEWSIVSVPSPAEAKGEVRLEGISCVSPSYCTAVGQYSPTASANPEELKTLTEYWDGAKWVVQASPNSSLKVNGLNQVSCSSAIACTAVGGARPELVPTLGEAALAARYE